MNKKNIRNFSIIAHIDHGKSTLADRVLELTSSVAKREMQNQMLDSMDLERERGITIKLNAVQIHYHDYVFHLIDTPGHVDFTYEVSRSLAASDGAILLVDAAQGIEAQTLANVYLAIENNLAIIPIINKIDLPAANVEKVLNDVEEILGIDSQEAILISAKNNINIEAVMQAIIERIPSPKNPDDNAPLKALVFDSHFDVYRGVILLIRVFEGKIKMHDEFIFMSTEKKFSVTELGIRNPKELKKDVLEAGEVGWIAASIRSAKDVSIGDTITLARRPTSKALKGYKKMKAVVFTGFYPIDSKDYILLRESLEKIALSDSSIEWELETSKALGFGFRVGFLGLLHMDVLQERLSREFKVDLIATAPSVTYEILLTNGKTIFVSNPSEFPPKVQIKMVKEPFIKAQILVTENYIGQVMELCQNKRGKFVTIEYYDKRVNIIYELPLGEIILDFFDRLKSVTKGYASFDYTYIENRESQLEKVDILLNHEKVDAFSFVTYRDTAYEKSRSLTEKLKKVIPRQNFEIPVQAVIGAKVVARETIKAFRKDVTAKLYGGDVTRRQKLLKKQKRGKKRMKSVGLVEVPQEAFLAVLKTEDN